MDDIEISSEGEWLTLVMGSVDMVLWDRDLTSNRVRTSVNYAQFYGLEGNKQDWTFQSFLDCLVPEDRPRVVECFNAALEGRGDYHLQFRKIGRDRQVRWCEAKGRIHRSADGTATRVTGVTWDVTGQRVSEERLSHIAKLVPGMVYQFKRAPNGAYSFPYCSDGIGALFGLLPAEVRDDAGPLLKRVHPDDLGVLLSTLDASARTLTLWRCEYRVLRNAVPERWILGTANPELQPDGSVLWHGYTKDITERKNTELTMREVNARLALALSAARMMTWYWDIASDDFVSSPPIDEILGADERHYTMCELFGLMPVEDAARVRDQFERIARDSITTPVIVEFSIALPDGQARLIESQARCALGPSGKSAAVIGVAVDVTRRRKVEKEREDLLLHLRDAQKIDSIGMLTGGIAHDFNNLLSSILGYSSLARDRYADQVPAKLFDYLTEIQHAGERGREMVLQLLAFGRGELPEVSPTNLQGLVEQTLKMVRATLPASIELTAEVSPALPRAVTHPTQFQQMLLNLCINARDAMEGAGRILVTLHEVCLDPSVCASCGKSFSGRHVLLSVIDAGPGIPDAIQSRIFDPFFSTKSNLGGTGMGLAMVHSLLHNHGGHICVETSPASGTRFNLYFVVHPSADADERPFEHARKAWHFSAPLRVLIVDDEPAVGRFFAEVLASNGHFADLEFDPLRALERFCATPDDYDLVITDLTMPKLSGADLARRIISMRPTMPILLVSGYSAGLGTEDAQLKGVRSFLQKPINADELMQAIHRVLRNAD